CVKRSEGALPRKKGSEPARVHTGVRLDAAIFERLSKSKLGLSEEIRQRVERTFREDYLDAVTRELRDGLAEIAALIHADFQTEWHTSPRAHKAFAAASAQRVAAYEPTEARSGGVGVSDLFGQSDAPETVGRLRELDDRRWHDYPHLKAAQGHKRRSRVAR